MLLLASASVAGENERFHEIKTRDSLLVGDDVAAMGSRITTFRYIIFSKKELLCITHTVEHNYISPSSTVGIQLNVSALYVAHLQVVI